MLGQIAIESEDGGLALGLSVSNDARTSSQSGEQGSRLKMQRKHKHGKKTRHVHMEKKIKFVDEGFTTIVKVQKGL